VTSSGENGTVPDPYTPETFYVFVDTSNHLVRHNLWFTRSIVAGALAPPVDASSNLMLTLNPSFAGDLSFFQKNITTDYSVEYSAERVRLEHFPHAPSRLVALYAFGSLDDARQASDLYRWPLSQVRQFTLEGGQVHRANMEIVSLMRHAWRAASIGEESQIALWSAYWSGAADYVMDLPDGPRRKIVHSGCLWEYLVIGRLRLVGEPTKDMEP